MSLNTNLLSSLRKRDIIFVIIIILLVAGIYFMLSRPREKEIVKVPYKVEIEVPGKQGKSDTIYLPRPYPVPQKNPVNDSILNLYVTAKDSITKLNLYIQAITEQSYVEHYRDTVQDIRVYSKVRGSLLEQQVSYTQYPSTIESEGETEVEIPKYNELYWKLSAGTRVLPNLQFKPVLEGEFILKNKRDELFSIEGNTRGDVLLGYGKRFNF